MTKPGGLRPEPRDLALYREVMGNEAADRQAELAKTTCRVCGGRDGTHHGMCSAKRRMRGQHQ